MFDFLFSIFKKEFQLSHISLISGHLADIVEIFDEEYVHDKNVRNSAIDEVIKMLESYKTPQG